MSFSPKPIRKKPQVGKTAFKQVETSARASNVLPSRDIMVQKTPAGTFLKLRNPIAAGGGEGRATPFYIAETQEWPKGPSGNSDPKSNGTYIEAHQGDPATVTKILLPQHLRHYWRPDTRALIRPAYSPGDVIYCVPLLSPGAAGETYLDLNVDGRNWAIGVTFCQNEKPEKYWIPVSSA